MRNILRTLMVRYDWIRFFRVLWHLVRARFFGYPDLGRMDAGPVEGSTKKVLIVTSVGRLFTLGTIDTVLAAALKLRNADVHALLCDVALPACQAAEYAWYPKIDHFAKYGSSQDLCFGCFKPSAKAFSRLGVKVHRYSEYLSAENAAHASYIASNVPFEQIKTMEVDGVAVGESAFAGTLRFFACSTLDGEPQSEPILRRFLEASIITAKVLQTLFEKEKFDRIVAHHGIYVSQGIVGVMARKEAIPLTTWNPAYKKHTFIFSHDDTYHRTMMNEDTETWKALNLTEDLEIRTMDYLASRWTGKQDWIWFHENPQFDIDDIARAIGVDFSKPCVGLLTNVVWDAQLHYSDNAFANMLDWIEQTIQYFAKRPDVQLLIRVHPAEINSAIPSRQRVTEHIASHCQNLPDNIFIIGPESCVSTYAAMMKCDSVIIYGTKTGVELASLGMQVVVAGEAWIRNKGLTLDANSPEEYFKILDGLPCGTRLDKEVMQNARKYAFHFFFRRMIPIKFIVNGSKLRDYTVKISGQSDLLPGKDRGLDVICNGILNLEPYVLPAEKS